MTTNVTALHSQLVSPSKRDPVGSFPRPTRTRVPVIAAHGWSGASTLARFLGDAVDDVGPGIPTDLGTQPVVVTAVGSSDGLREAIALLDELQTSHVLPIVLVVRGDGLWPDSLAVRHRLRVLRGNVAVIRIPYVGHWRFVDGEPMAPPRYLAAVDAVQAALVKAQETQINQQRRPS